MKNDAVVYLLDDEPDMLKALTRVLIQFFGGI